LKKRTDNYHSLGSRLAITSDTQDAVNRILTQAENDKQAKVENGPNLSIEKLKSQVQERLAVAYASNVSMIAMMMKVYTSNPKSVNLEFWQGVLQEEVQKTKEAVKKPKSDNANVPNPAIEEIKKEAKPRLKTTYDANPVVVETTIGSDDGNPEAGKLAYLKKLKVLLGGEAAPLDHEREQRSGDWSYIDDGGKITVTRYWNKYEEEIRIPAKIEGKPVMCIGECAFEHVENASKVTIPDGVVEIGERAFHGLAFLRHLTIPDSVVTIGDKAFDGCKLVSVRFGRGLKTIGQMAFDGNQLTELTIPDNVTSIGESAFDGNFIEKLTIGKGLTLIPERAFSDNNLKKVIIPDNIKEVGEKAFFLWRDSQVIVPDTKIITGKEAFGQAKLIKASDYKQSAFAVPAVKAIRVDEKSKIIDLSVENPSPCGRGWTFSDGVYTIHDWANVTITGDNKKSGRRIEVAKGARKVNITLQDVTMWTDTESIVEDKIYYWGSPQDIKMPLLFRSPVTLWLKGKNTIVTNTVRHSCQGKNFTFAGIGIGCRDLTITGKGSLSLTGSISGINPVSNNGDECDLTVYGGKINILYGYVRAKDITINGGEIIVGKRNEKEYTDARIYSKAFTVNGGKVTATNDRRTAIESDAIAINGGEVTATNNSWAYDGFPPHTPAIGGKHTSKPTIAVRGGTVTATVEKTSIAAAIGVEGEKMDRNARPSNEFDLVMTGGTVHASKLKGRKTKDRRPSKTNIGGVTGGELYEGEKCVFKGKSPKPSAPPKFVPDIFEYVDERAEYKVIDGFEMMLVKNETDYYIGVIHVTQKQWTEITGFNPSMLQRNLFDLETQIEWAAVLGAKPSRFAGCGFYPVECVSYTNIMDFIAKLNKKTGKNFRLPTEAEWEYAARGGIKSQDSMNEGSNDLKKVSTKETPKMIITPTAVKDCNELGLYDMSGSVKEWTADKEDGRQVIRGGGRISDRDGKEERHKDNGIGFRLALSAE
jgi:hypothetical protein